MFYVREADKNDFDAVNALLSRSYNVLLKDAYAPSVFDKLIKVATEIQIELIESGRFYVAEEQGNLLGCGGWVTDLETDSARDKTMGVLRKFAVSPEMQRCGVGSEILNQCISAARVEGLTGFECYTTPNSVPFFRNNGFVVEGETLIEQSEDRSQGIPMVLMQRQFELIDL